MSAYILTIHLLKLIFKKIFVEFLRVSNVTLFFYLIIILLLISLEMILTPVCTKSKKTVNRLCIHSKCTSPAFICNYCDNYCLNLHQHNGKSQIIKWSEITMALENMNNMTQTKLLQQSVNKIERQISIIISQLRSIVRNYNQIIQKRCNHPESNPLIQQVLQKLRKESYNDISGKQMKQLYQQLRNYQSQNNEQDLETLIKEQRINFEYMLTQIKKDIQLFKGKSKIEKKQKKQNSSIQTIQQNRKKSTSYIQKGIRLYENKQFEAAKKYFQDAIKCEQTNDQAYLYLGKVFKKLQKWRQAQSQFTKSIDINPKSIQAYYNRALLLECMKKHQKALLDYNKAIEFSNGKFAEIYFNRALLFQQLNKPELALQDYNKCIQLDSKDAQTYYNRGFIHHNLKNFELAMSDYNSALKYDPKLAQAYYNRALIFQKKKQMEKALLDYTKLIELNKLNELGYKGRAQIYRKLNKIRQAQADQKQYSLMVKRRASLII